MSEKSDAAITRLNTAVSGITAEVDALKAIIAQPSPDAADLASALAAIDTASAALEAKLPIPDVPVAAEQPVT